MSEQTIKQTVKQTAKDYRTKHYHTGQCQRMHERIGISEHETFTITLLIKSAQ